MLCPALGYFDQITKAPFALLEACHYCLLWELWEVLVLNDEVVQVVTKVIGTCSTTMTIKDTEKAYLGPL